MGASYTCNKKKLLTIKKEGYFIKYQKKTILLALFAMAMLNCGTLTAVAASTDTPNTETSQESENCIILGKDAEKESDGIAKVSFDLGETWSNQSEALYSETDAVEYWTFVEYQSYSKAVEQDLIKMFANGEPDVTLADIQSWRADTTQILAFIKNGGKLSKNIIDEDSQLMISTFDGSIVEKTSER